MEREESTLIVPDVHSRPFWKIVKNSDLPVVFLGDYTDPYPQEGYTREHTLANFEEILAFANEQKDRVTLLLGNHDCQMLGYSPSYCRMDFTNASKYYKLFLDNKNLFKFAYKWNNTLFTHAGVTNAWLEYNDIEEDPDTIVDILNKNIVFTDKYWKEFNFSRECEVWDTPISQISVYRGGDYQFGSPIWADIDEMALWPAFKDNLIQIFGHTQLSETGCFVHQNNWYMCDSRSVFIWDGKELKIFK